MAASPIGEIPVVITGDWSELQVAIDQAANAASAGAQQIASAFESTGSNTDLFAGISDQVAAASTSMEEMAGSVTIVEDNLAALSAASQSAEAGIETIPPALHEVSESAHEAESGVAEFGEQLLKFGEALAITEGLKELASEALETFGAIEKASISLAALTGSMEEAEATIAGLKTLAIGDALSFESLVTATQRMAAFGFSAEETTKTLKAAADAAAATARPIDDVASAINRMVLSGTAGGRQLAALGISMKALGDALGVAADQAKAAFAALDQSARIEAITTALQKYSGVAAAAAQGIAGQLKNFGTQVEFIMEEVGKAITPLVSDILKFAQTDVLPFIKGLVDGFNALPGPLKEAAVAFTALGVAVPIVALSMGALSTGLAAAASALGPLVQLAGAVSNVGFAVMNGLVPALTAGETAILLLGQGVIYLGAAFVGLKIGEWADRNIPAFNALTDAIHNFIMEIPGVQQAMNSFTGVSAAEDSLAAATQKLNDKLQNLGQEVVRNAGESMESFATRVRAAAAALGTTAEAAGKVLPYMLALQKALLTVDDENQKLKDNFNAASLALEAATLAYQYHSITLGELKSKQDAYNTALYAMNPAAKAAADAAKAFADQITALNKAAESVSVDAFAALSGSADQAGAALTKVTATINQLLDAFQQTSNPKTRQALQDLINQLAHLQTQLQAVVEQKAFQALGDQLDGLLTKYPHALDTLDQATQDWAKGVIAATQKARDSFANLTDKQVIDDFENSLKGLSESANKLANDFNVSVGKMHTAAAEQIKITVDWRTEVGNLANSYMEMTTLATKYHLNEISSLSQELTDLRALFSLQQQFNTPLSQQLATEAKLLQTQIDLGAATGETAQQTLEWQQQLTAVQIKQNLLKQDTVALSNLYSQMVQAFGKAWDDLGKNIGDALVDGHNFGAAISKVFDDLKKSLAELVTNYLLGELKRAFLENTDAVNTFGKVFAGIFGGGGSVGTVTQSLQAFDKQLMDGMDRTVATVSEAGNAVQSSATQMSSSMQKTAQSVSASASQMVTGLTAVATVVSAIASIFSAIELMHTNTLLDRIEHETARMAIYLGDSGANSIQYSTGKTAEILGYLHTDTSAILSALQTISSTLTNILATSGGVGGGGGEGTAALLQTIADLQDQLTVLQEEMNGPYGIGGISQDLHDALQGQLEAAQKIVDIDQKQLDVITAQYNDGKATKAQVTTAQNQLKDAQDALAKIVSELAAPVQNSDQTGGSSGGGSSASVDYSSLGAATAAPIIIAMTLSEKLLASLAQTTADILVLLADHFKESVGDLSAEVSSLVSRGVLDLPLKDIQAAEKATADAATAAASGTSAAAAGLSNVGTAAMGLTTSLSTVTSTATQAAASINAVTQQLAKVTATVGPGTPGFNAMVQPTPATPTSAPTGALGYNTMISGHGLASPVYVNVTTGGILGVQTAAQLAKVVQDQIVSRLQTQGIRVTRG